ncbi:hypothetical protein Cch01nite_40550 [Cellulomonas chitinilytica]|uniref:ParB-like N-terminal domain-containing protein n=1 Tax=Cellulomonas chitinilytica TaxID=398759 RepID=A0A919U3I2_9CELL|nr:ParB N-terminal domain-containing protein [Cellulomonas chitinilytica]GIG23331.1 hypothetical protein Cch01nite_40550 [Cellulomonas chitinilytica]
MTDTITTVATYEVGHLYEVAPGDLKIGANVRVDPHPDAKQFSASIRARGVIEPVTAFPDVDGTLTVLRGQRRTIVATQVGTPTIPVRVIAPPDEADRITDQITENLHREAMHERETRDGIEQLALLNLSAAQIAKRTAVARPVIDAALTVAASPATRERMDAEGYTLEEAAIFAEFEDDAVAIARLTSACTNLGQRGRLAHVAQVLRDERAERAALSAEVERLRVEGLPVLDPQDAPSRYDLYRLRLDELRDADNEPVPQETWPTIPGGAVVITVEWSDEDDADHDDEAEGTEPGEPHAVFVPVWICTDPDAAGLHYGWRPSPVAGEDNAGQDVEARAAAEQARQESESAERRRVRTNNEAWRASEVVRREWLRGLLARRTVPAGAEALIARALLTREYSLTAALDRGHSLLGALLGQRADGLASEAANRALEQVTTPKLATMRTLAVVLSAWEAASGVHTWRNPRAYDGHVMSALVDWGYGASEVEHLLIPVPSRSDDAEPPTSHDEDGTDDPEPDAAA